MIDKHDLYDDLVEAFIYYQWRVENPMPTTQETKENMIHRYRSDIVFHNKVDSLAAGVMQILDKYIKDAGIEVEKQYLQDPAFRLGMVRATEICRNQMKYADQEPESNGYGSACDDCELAIRAELEKSDD